MNPSARPQTSRNRDRALNRLRSITTGTAVAASIATAGFGGLAALTYTGTTDASTGSTNTTLPAGGAVDGTTTTGTRTGSTTTTVTGLQPTVPPVTTTRTKTHVTSGGSGG